MIAIWQNILRVLQRRYFAAFAKILAQAKHRKTIQII
jgi:hypothetical protein